MVVYSAASCGDTAPKTTPYIEVGYGYWLIADAETVALNGGVGLDMDPDNYGDGTWVWSGPNGYSSVSHDSRAIYGVPLIPGLNVFQAVFVDPLNCASTQAFAITAESTASPGLLVDLPALAIEQRSSGQNGMVVSSLNGFNGAVVLSAAGLPAGVTATFSPSSVNLSTNGIAQPVLTLTASSSAPAGTYTVTVTATAGPLSAVTPFALTILPPGDCASITEVVPYIQVNGQGWSAQSSETVSTTASVELDVQPVPFLWGQWFWSGPNGFFDSTTVGNVLESIPLSPGNNTWVGTFISPVDSCEATLTFNINATAAKTFDIAATWPPAVTLSPGNVWTNAISVTSVNGFSSPVALSASGLPAGVAASFSPPTVTPTTGNVATSTLTLTVASTPAMGTATVSVTGTASGPSNSVPIALTIVPTTYTATLTPSTLSFAVQNTGSTSAAQLVTLKNTGTGTVAIASIAITGVFSQSNSCGTSLAPGASCSISVTFTPVADGVVTGALTVTDNTTTSPHTVSLSGTGAGTPCTGNICFSGNFTTPGQYIYTSAFASTAGAITATLTAPTGTSWRFSLINETLNQGITEQDGAGPLTITYSATAGTYAFFLQVTSGTGAWQINGSYSTGLPSGAFSVSGQVSTLALNQGTAATSTITVASSNGFISPVALSIAGLPSGVTATFSPASLTPAANGTAVSTLTLTASSVATPGTNSATVTGTSGSLTSSVPMGVTVSRAIIAPVVTVTPTPSSVSTMQAVTVAVSVSGGGGNPAPTGSILLTCGSYKSASSSLSGGSVSITIPAGSLPVGSNTLTASYTPDAASAPVYKSASGTSPVITVSSLAASPVFTPVAGTYTAAQTVTITDSTAGAVIYYTTNGDEPTTSSARYTAAIKVSATETIRAIAVSSSSWNSVVISATYNIALPTAAPTFTPAAGTYNSPQTVTISDSTRGATIYYTTNGAAPTVSSAKYTSAGIRVSATETVRAIAVASGYSTSSVAAAAYTIASAPSVTTTAATALTASGAQLNGTVTANNATTQYWFAYGASKSSLTSMTTRTGALTGMASTNVGTAITGLKSKTTYYFQAMASNAVGTTPGTVLSFTTK